MAKFGIGESVIILATDTIGTIIKVMPERRGRQLYTVSSPQGNCDVFETDLKVNFDKSDPFERCKNGIFGSYSEYSKRNTTFKIKNSNNSTISSLKASKTLFRPYQFKPLLKFLNSPNRRLLVADEVGLGKTIEAGHVMLELKARRELKNVLIVCPKSLQVKWQAELYEKFGLSFKIVESTRDLIADLSSRAGYVRAIVNYEKIRIRKVKKNDKKNDNIDNRTTNFIDFLSENHQRFSLVLCDEAHKMRNKETLIYKGAEILLDCADAALFLTATPIMIDEENLYNLLHLLDNSRYFNYQIFENRLKENRPFIEAITKLNQGIAFEKIEVELLGSIVQSRFLSDGSEIFSKSRSVGDIYKDDPIFAELISLFRGEDNLRVRARIQYLLSTMSVMNTVFSRTRKREVTTDMSQAERSPHICKVELSEVEQDEFDKVIEDYTADNSYDDEWGEERLTQGGSLGLVQRKRQIASSIWGYKNEESSLNIGIDAYEEFPDSKIEMLDKIIKEVFKSGTKKLVVFALFRRTLKYLSIRLKKLGYNSLMIHGQIENRAEILDCFKHDQSIQILLSSEVGSEGLDMQFCNSMVNYDLPWNPMVVEQRIGRIDRFGQKAEVVNIYNIVVAGSIQEEIYMRLLDRIGIFRGTIGDLEAILDAPVVRKAHVDGKAQTIQEVYRSMEKEFFTKKLSRDEKEKKIAEVERAIENERENLQHLQEGLSNTLTNDAYFKDEINRILHNNAYVTEAELHNFLESAIQKILTTCNLEEVSKGVWEFKLPLSQPNVLRNFLNEYCEHTDESEISLRQFKTKIGENLSFKLTFNQDIAYENISLNYLNIYHPMIQSCLNFFINNDDKNNTSFSYALPADELLTDGSFYFMGLYQILTSVMIHGTRKTSAELLPVVFNIQTKRIENNTNIIDRLFSRSQVVGKERNVSNHDINLKLIDDVRYDFADFISAEKKRRIEQAQNQMVSDRLRNTQQTTEYYTLRIKNHETNIYSWTENLKYSYVDEKESRRWKGAIQLARANIKQLEKELKERLELLNEDAQLNINEKLISLNLIYIH